jgi:hypothetical protein
MANSFSNINSRDMSASVAAVSEAARACERAETFSVTTDIQGTAAVIWISTKYSGNIPTSNLGRYLWLLASFRRKAGVAREDVAPRRADPLDSPRTPRYRQRK